MPSTLNEFLENALKDVPKLEELTKDSLQKAFADAWDAISEIVPTARKMGIDVKITDLVPLRKELDKIEKKLKKKEG
jgi:hypothetical protein